MAVFAGEINAAALRLNRNNVQRTSVMSAPRLRIKINSKDSGTKNGHIYIESRAIKPDSQNGKPQNKLKKSGVFFVDGKRASKPHDSPPLHHKFTIQKPHKCTHFLRKPTQKTAKPPTKKIIAIKL
jgi:hypothetical protein